jgi:hypothetical protein
MQVIEKVKVVPEGYNGAGMNYDGGNRRDVNGKANAGLTLGIIGTALGAWALFGNRRSAGASILGGAGGGMLGDGSTNINVLGATAGSGSGAPTAFQAWEKSCEDTLALQGGLYQWALTQQNQRLKIENVLIVNCLVPFFIYLNFSMDKFIDVIVDGILSNFDFGFMFIVNVLTYIIIKVIDYFNGDNKVPTWQKRCVLVISIVAMIGIYIAAGYDNAIMLVNSAILAPVFWSWVVSPILKKLGVGYKDIDNTIG